MSLPALRFKEFQGDWNKQLLGDIFTFKNGINASKEQYGSGYKFINVLDIINNDFIYYENIIGSVNVSAQEFIKNEVRYGDVLFQRSSETRDEVGQSNVYLGKQPVTFGGFVIRGRGIAEYSPQFFNYILKTDSVRDEVTQRSGGSTRYNIGQDSLNVVPISLPSIDEQTKIGTFLKSVDEKIHHLTQKHDLLTQYKKGVMQQIFSQELRFKDDDGQDFPEWEEESLGNLLDYEQPTKYLVSSTEYSDSFKTPVLTAGKTFILGYTDETVGICEQGLPVIIFDDFTTAFKFVPFPFKAKSSAMKILRKKTGVNINYIYSAMQLIDFPSGDEHKRYWISEYSKVMISLPCAKEQTKIANFLTAIDNKITATQTQLQVVKQYKQGLLQQMFV